MTKGKTVQLGEVSLDLAKEIIRAGNDRSETVNKVLSTCLKEGQVDAAGEVKKGLDELQEFTQKVQVLVDEA